MDQVEEIALLLLLDPLLLRHLIVVLLLLRQGVETEHAELEALVADPAEEWRPTKWGWQEQVVGGNLLEVRHPELMEGLQLQAVGNT